jgi:hypothetical protein
MGPVQPEHHLHVVAAVQRAALAPAESNDIRHD